MANDADLEISLFALKKEKKFDDGQVEEGAHRYQAVLRYQEANSATEPGIGEGEVCLDFSALRGFETDKTAYGKLLAESLFKDQAIRDTFLTAVRVAEQAGCALHVRLLISSQAEELQNLVWESMLDPRSEYTTPLLTKPNIYFSRYFRSSEWGRINLHERGELTALVVIANPSDISKYVVIRGGGENPRSLAELDVPKEIEQVCKHLEGIKYEVLASNPTTPGKASLKEIGRGLENFGVQGCDILYVVCHGAILTKPVPGAYLYLEKENGKVDRVEASTFIEQLADMDLEKRPRLVVFASCQSGGSAGNRFSEDGGAFMPIGPKLVEAGIPAVLAMQDNVSMVTISDFMSAFFKELSENGMIDRAVNRARMVVKAQPDSWMPVLFMRLRGGYVWRTGSIGAASMFGKWPTMESKIKLGTCLPILGPGMIERYVGNRGEIADYLARIHSYPLLDHDRDNLPLVTQFLTIDQDQDFLNTVYMDSLQKRLGRTFSGGEIPNYPIDEGLVQAYKDLVIRSEFELHLALAGLRQPLYITTNPDGILALAIKQVLGVEPFELICPWRPMDDVDTLELPPFSRERPLVFYLFGKFNEPSSLVLTQDDYFDFLISVTRQEWRIPEKIRRSMLTSMLLFLGFPIEDWGLRLLIRYLLTQPTSRLLIGHTNVAVQLDPEFQRISDPERARKFFQNYFKTSNVEIFWGPLKDFMQTLNLRAGGGGMK
jgi:hypothetical protein